MFQTLFRAPSRRVADQPLRNPSTHDLSRNETMPALWAQAYLTGCGEPLRESIPASLRWLQARWDAGDEHLPLGLVHDLGYLLLRGREFRFASSRDLADWPAHERVARRAYEDRVLGRWALDPSVADAHVAIAGMSPAHRDVAVAHAVGLALAGPLRTAHDPVYGNAAALRSHAQELCARAPVEWDDWHALLDPEWVLWARAHLDACIRALPTERLFRAEDLWELAHLRELPSESTRLALRQVHTVASQVGPLPASVALALRRRAREVPVEQDENDEYPMGGFDAISTRGIFENMVRTEVVYVGEGKEQLGGIDLFDVRFVEGELLYYTRDESPRFDVRRDVTIVLDRPAEMRFKQPRLTAQTLVLAEGVALALQADFLRVFGPAGSHFTLVWRAPGTEDQEVAAEEKALVGFSLAAEVAHHRVGLALASNWSAVPESGRVVFSSKPPDETLPYVAWVRVGEERWYFGDESYDIAEGPEVLRTLSNALLLAIVKGRRRMRGTR